MNVNHKPFYLKEVCGLMRRTNPKLWYFERVLRPALSLTGRAGYLKTPAGQSKGDAE